MKLDCKVAEDLMPLYYDGHCRSGSALLLKEHLNECEACRNLYKELISSDIVEQVVFDDEKEDRKSMMLRKKFKRYRLLSYLIIGTVTGLMLLPVLYYAILLLYSLLTDLF